MPQEHEAAAHASRQHLGSAALAASSNQTDSYSGTAMLWTGQQAAVAWHTFAGAAEQTAAATHSELIRREGTKF